MSTIRPVSFNAGNGISIWGNLSSGKKVAVVALGIISTLGLLYYCWSREGNNSGSSNFKGDDGILEKASISSSSSSSSNSDVERIFDHKSFDPRIMEMKQPVSEKLQKSAEYVEQAHKNESSKQFKVWGVDDILAYPISGSAEEILEHQVGIAYSQGKRETMEDAHCATSLKVRFQNGQEYQGSVFGIFDGHAGDQCAIEASKHIPVYIKEELEKVDFTEDGIYRALRQSFIQFAFDYEQVRNEGTTALVALVLQGKLWVANLGDSRAVLMNGDRNIQCTHDAKPDDSRFTKKIKSLGGSVSFRRINSTLATGGAFGNNTKTYPPKRPGDAERLNKPVPHRYDNLRNCVPFWPQITCFPLDEIDKDNSFLVLACDGLYEVASTDQVLDTVRNHSELEAKALADLLVRSALHSGSTDNVSVMVLPL